MKNIVKPVIITTYSVVCTVPLVLRSGCGLGRSVSRCGLGCSVAGCGLACSVAGCVLDCSVAG